MPDRSVWRMLFRSSDGELVVKQNVNTDELIVSASGTTAKFDVKGGKVTFVSAAESA
jgi:hypothetical protein